MSAQIPVLLRLFCLRCSLVISAFKASSTVSWIFLRRSPVSTWSCPACVASEFDLSQMSTIHLTAIAANLNFLMGMSTVRLSIKTEHNKALLTPEGKTSRLHWRCLRYQQLWFHQRNKNLNSLSWMWKCSSSISCFSSLPRWCPPSSLAPLLIFSHIMQQVNSLFGPKAKLVIVGTVKRQTKMALVSFIVLLFSMEVYSYENYCFFNGVWWFLQERYRAVAG